MLVGIGRAEITPPLGESIMGYYVERLTKGVLDPLYVTAAAFSDGDKKAMIIELDVCELYTDDCSKYRKRLSDELGIDVESLGENVNIVIQVEGEEDGDLVLDDGTEVVIFDEDDDDEITEPNEWYFDDDPYEIVYYEFPDFD